MVETNLLQTKCDGERDKLQGEWQTGKKLLTENNTDFKGKESKGILTTSLLECMSKLETL